MPNERQSANDPALVRRPEDAEGLHKLGLQCLRHGDAPGAVELLGRAAAMQPGRAAYHVDLADAFRASGEFERAAGSCRVALMLRPDYPAALDALGLALRRLGRLDEAAATLRRALELRPDMVAAHNHLGLVLQDLGRKDEAIAAFRRAVALAPNRLPARRFLAEALLEAGEAAEALPHLQEAVRLGPKLAALHDRLGNALRALDRFAEARAAYLEAVRLNPKLARAHLRIGTTLRRENRLDEALPWYERAVSLAPNVPAFWEQLAELRADRDEPEEASACWKRALAASKGDRASARIGLGLALVEEGRLPEAREQLEIAARLEPDSAPARLHLGVIHEQLGEMPEAEAAFRAARRLDPAFPMPLARLATMLRDKLPDDDLAALEKRLDDPKLRKKQRTRLLFALAHVLDARGDYGRAADSLRVANAMALEMGGGDREYDPADHDRFISNLIRAFHPGLFARLAGAGHESRRPVFIVGLPRSGTTLVEQVLASHPAVHGAGELRLARRSFEAIPGVLGRPGPPVEAVADLDAASVRRLAEGHLEWLRALDGGRAARVVDKMPDNYMHLGLLSLLFPGATFIHCRRDLRDVAVSCWMTDFGSIRWANSPSHIARRFREYRRLMAHWRSALPTTLHEVDYEETVGDLEGVARRLLAACGLDWDPACLEFYRTKRQVRTASIAQVRQPVYTKSVARWRHYERALSDLFAALPRDEDRPA